MSDAEHEPDANNDSADSSNSEVQKRSQRSKGLSLKSKENKVLALTTEMTKCIIAQLSRFESSTQSLLESVDVTKLEEVLIEIDQEINVVQQLYNELFEICKAIGTIDNKVSKETETMFADYCSDMKALKESVNQNITEIKEEDKEEKELEIQMEELKRQLEEQTKLYNVKKIERTNRQERTAHPPPSPQSLSQNATVQEYSDTTSSVEFDHARSQAPPPLSEIQLPYSPPSSSTNGMSAMQQFAAALANTAETLATSVNKAAARKISVEPTIFSGDVLEFIDWEIDMDAYLEAEGIKDGDKLRHLKKYVDREAKRCIQGHFYTNTVEAYRNAREKLTERFGDKREITKSFRRQLTEWPSVKNKDGKGLREFGDFLSHIKAAMKSLPALRILNDEQENQKICEKLPEWLRTRWFRVADNMEEREYRYPTLSEFVDFVNKEARILLRQAEQPPTIPPTTRYRQREARSLSTITGGLQCDFCNGNNHGISDCFSFEAQPMEERVKYVQEHLLCFGCMMIGHRSRECETRSICKRCKKSHPTALHDKNFRREFNRAEEKRPQTVPNEAKKTTGSSNEQDHQNTINVKATSVQGVMYSMMVPVYISAGGKEKLVYALLDTQSDASFVTTTVAREIDAVGAKQELTISTMNGEKTATTIKYNKLKIRGYLTDNETSLEAYEQEKIQCNRENIPNNTNCANLHHLRKVINELPPVMDIPIGLLIGVDCPEALIQHQTVPGKRREPFATRTMFGWTLCGGTKADNYKNSFLNKVEVKKDTEILRLLERDFQDIEDSKMSQQDLQFMKCLESETFQTKNGNYVLPLPFKETPSLPNNRAHAEKRLEQLIKKLRTDKNYKEEYFNFMDNLLKNGHAEEVRESDTVEGGSIWYIPHFGVRHPKKKKLRVVFDASARYGGTSLNDHLLQGPDHINNMIGILGRFRKEQTAVCCDVEQMFYNFYVPAKHRNYLRFLWITEDFAIREYRMTVHLFGATSSPAVATFGLRKMAADYAAISPEASTFLVENFYVDDGITSTPTTTEAIKLVQGARDICRKGNVHLHKFVSNDKAVLQSIPVTERSANLQTSDLINGILPVETTLGLEWCIETDCFKFSNNVITKPTTKRGLLSTVAQVYDPLGFLAPFILKGKQILQKCTASSRGWDQPISKDILQDWNTWVIDLSELETIAIPRCLKVTTAKEIARTEVHHFSDASMTGYGACSYLRLIYSDNSVHCVLLFAKARVSPLKPVTIPRLELQAAVVAARIGALLRREFRLDIDDEVFWTDSKIVLGYICNQTKRFHMYVTNRVHAIKEMSKDHQWHYVSTKDNPADLASRGCTVAELKESSFLNGPEFLKQPDISSYLELNSVERTVREDDPEVKSVKVLKVVTQPTASNMLHKFEKYSTWDRLSKSIAILRQIARKKKWSVNDIQPDDIRQAELFVIKELQTEHYRDEINELLDHNNVKKQSPLAKLNPFISKDGLLCVGGRLHMAAGLTELDKHPIILPKFCHIATLIIRHHHERIHHLGQRSTLASVRESGFWIINGPGIVKGIIRRCTTCARLRRSPEAQQMGNLPAERLEQTPPFTHVGMDVFGPFIIKDRRTELKRWGLLFTCLYSRAIHIEILEDMSTDAFLNALRCLIAIRGPVKTLFSDQGTNFVGARNELQKLIESVKEPKTKQYLLSNKIEFKLNAPESSHKGGSWERLIRSVRAVLNGMAARFKGRLDTNTLRTAFYEAMSIVNSRPITASNINNPEESIITPNHLLTMKTQGPSAPPPGNFDNDELYSRRRWQKAQCFAQQFWKEWKSDYLSQLTQRQRWTQEQQNVKVGDLVIVVGQDTPRATWKVGIIQEVRQGSGNLVRTVKVKMGNRSLDMKGIPYTPATVLERPVQKIVVIAKA